MAKRKKAPKDIGLGKTILSDDRGKREADRINWYPGHMARAVKKIEEKLKLVDVVIEVRDARVPLSTSNPRLNQVLNQKPRVVVFNKANFANEQSVAEWKNYFQKQDGKFIFVNALDQSASKKVLEIAKTLVSGRRVTLREEGRVPIVRMMIVGLPNTGKSTLINTLVGKTIARAADKPGYTQSQQWIKLPGHIELLDTPGVMVPRVENDEQGMWLCSIHAIKDEIPGTDRVALFVLKKMIKNPTQEFLDRFELDDLGHFDELRLLDYIGEFRKCLGKGGVVDYDRVYTLVLSEFRKGLWGRFSFEKVPRN